MKTSSSYIKIHQHPFPKGPKTSQKAALRLSTATKHLDPIEVLGQVPMGHDTMNLLRKVQPKLLERKTSQLLSSIRILALDTEYAL